ncbi:MAG: hypothetical protein V4695_05050 [Pseudomonadota bacterium]
MGAPLMLLFQILPFWFAAYYLLRYLQYGLGVSIAVAVLLCIWPTIFLMGGVIFKDTIATNFIILGFMLLLRRHDDRHHLIRCCLCGVALGIACLCRYQYAVVLVPALMALWLQPKDSPTSVSAHRPLLLSSALTAAFLLTIVGANATIAIFSKVGTDNLGANLQRLMIYDLAGILKHEPNANFDVLKRANIDTDNLKSMLEKHYKPDRVDPIIYDALGVRDNGQRYVNILPGADLKLLTDQWLETVRQYPRAWLAHHMASFEYLLNLRKPYACWAHYPPVSVHPPEIVTQLQLEARVAPLSLRFTDIGKWPTPLAVFLRHWIALAACVVAAGILLFGRAKSPAILGLSTACLLFSLTFFVFNMACDARYLYLVSAALPFILIVVLDNFRRPHKDAGI